jgi:hypothetical protein
MGARSALICGAAAVAALAYPSAAAAAPGPSAGADVRVPADDGSQGVYQSADQLSGGNYTGTVLARCGHGRRIQNEPTLAIDPRATSLRASGPTGHRTMPVAGDARAGCCRSTDSGRSKWTGSLLPGYNGDTSAQGRSSSLHQLVAGGALADDDPMMAWGDPRYMGNSFNRGTENGASGGTRDDTGSIWVAPYAPGDPGSPATGGSRHVRTIVLAQNTPGKRIFTGKTDLTVDPATRNVHAAWPDFHGGGCNEILFSRSADHGATSTAPLAISSGSAAIRPLDRDRAGRAARAGREFAIGAGGGFLTASAPRFRFAVISEAGGDDPATHRSRT